MKKCFLVWLYFVSCATLFAQHSEFYTIESQTSSELTIRFTFEDVIVSSGNASNPEYGWQFEIPGLPQNYQSGGPLLPVLTIPLAMPDASFSTSYTVSESEHFVGQYPIRFQDVVNDPDEANRVPERRREIQSHQARSVPGETAPEPILSTKANATLLSDAATSLYRTSFPEEFVSVNELGMFRDYKLGSMVVYPLQVAANGVVFYKEFTVTLHFNHLKIPVSSVPSAEAALLRKMVANDQHVPLLQAALPPPSSPNPPIETTTADQRARIVVKEHGIYQVNGFDLLESGVDIASILPGQLRISNKGEEIAFYMVGDEDGSFDEEDFFEFWGERNEKTFYDEFPDQYADPFSDENVYWLEWGASPGIRMIEENGNIVTSVQGEFNPSFYYNTSVHIESNVHFARLGEGSPEQLSYQRDLWFIDSGIKAAGKQQYLFELTHPDPSSFNPVFVRAMFSGQSFGAYFGSQPVPHNVMVWLNNGFVGSSSPTWFDQDTSSIHNFASSSLRTNDLIHGTNTLEVQLPELPDITIQSDSGAVVVKGSDIVLLNWFDVSYDRLYKASDNVVEFTKPAFIPYPQVDLFQFDVDEFTGPDIDLYKKGVSKIVNFVLDSEERDGETIYKILFQDHILSENVEYIALTEDQKKKPLRIEPDEPLDEDDLARTLRDPLNAAEYVIITHSRFYENAIELLDYRRSHGVAAELIDVQEIYDEFNHGIKSPLAIQEFLRYAFFNWSRTPRLQYVLLLGGANFNYKSTTAVDFVPTFFVQTETFGASATDLPYALVSGEDLVPDLFVGRVPVTTNSDVSSVVSKIIEYESATAGAWRNQALMISGNDSYTEELSGQLGLDSHAFRDQNTRFMESIVPNSMTSKRLNTVRDEDIPDTEVDPDFGSDTHLIDHWNEGLGIVNFIGHGGGGIWSDREVMNLDDVDRLTNQGQYPIVTSMTCFTGAFENPNSLGLAQKLVLAEDRGAIGVLASSGLGYLHNDYSMLWYLGQYIFNPDIRVGEMVTLGKILYWSFGQNYNVDGDIYGTPGWSEVKHEMMHQYNLLGEPYVRINFTQPDLTLELSSASPLPGETVTVTISSNLGSADGYVELVDNDLRIIDREFVFSVGATSTTNIVVPEDFPEGLGYVRAYLNDGAADASGSVSIGINHAVLEELTFSPEQPGVGDSVQVLMRVSDRFNIERVYVVEEHSSHTTPDTLEAVQFPADTALFASTMPPADSLQTVFFNVYIENSIGNTSVFKNRSYIVDDERPDVGLIANSLRFTGSSAAELKVSLNNRAGAGDDGEIDVNVGFYDGLKNYLIQNPFATGSVTMGALDSASLSVDFPLDLSRSEFDLYARASIDPSEGLEDFNPDNDTLHQVLMPTIFNVDAETGSDTISLGNNFRIYFPAGCLSQSSAVTAQLVQFDAPTDQTALTPLSSVEAGIYHAAEVRLLNPAAEFLTPFLLQVDVDSTLNSSGEDLEQAKLYQKSSNSRPWIFESSGYVAGTNTLFANISSSALFAPFLSDDVRSPQIEMTVNGRPLITRGLVSPNPSLYLLVQDESGVNLDADKVSLQLNGNPLADDKVFIPDSVQQNSVVGMTLYPELGSGSHTLDVTFEDVNGNLSQTQYELVVNEDFDIHIYGNYPNPFVDQTIFSYFVVAQRNLDEFEIKIFTVSGRKVRSITSDINNPENAIDDGARRVGYNELVWDGTDNNGNPVANGVYFAIVKGVLDGETIEKVMKVARLR